jgi:hypothetical protein
MSTANTTTVSISSRPSNVPKLDPTGFNWVIYCIRFSHAVQSKGVWEHLDSSKPHPGTKSTAEELAVWDKDEAIALDLLTQRIPDSTVIWTMNLNSATIMWAEIVREYCYDSDKF